MKHTTGNTEDLSIKEVSKDGVKLIVIASRTDTNDWMLSVQNEFGISSNWLEYFPGAQLAIDTALQTIDEDIEPFLDTEGFEYLFDEIV